MLNHVDAGRIGIWTSALDRQPAAVVRRAAAEVERLGFGALLASVGRRVRSGCRL